MHRLVPCQQMCAAAGSMCDSRDISPSGKQASAAVELQVGFWMTGQGWVCMQFMSLAVL